MGLDTFLRCAKCGHGLAANGDHGIPDLMAYCPACAVVINRQIQKNLMSDTGHLRGSVRIVNGRRAGGSNE